MIVRFADQELINDQEQLLLIKMNSIRKQWCVTGSCNKRFHRKQ